ncbi:MAG TPA: FG-GAP-like repeat-containing protein [Flavobacterium sp.]|uniref:FG-GAP-like repeat-containing protein n=1 Tax=Flavobacterium sp. TaxID=239 RepID=UPI002DBED518|nr:FG-GAP-like repeat-containing protein [Flavobacterium sp.]HEU4788693.1 FG-GAP-like repeat-containing protein [Flavobacterium sp.]
MKLKHIIPLFLLLPLVQSCEKKVNPNDEMVAKLASTYQKYSVKDNSFCPQAEVAFFDSIINHPSIIDSRLTTNYFKGNSLLKLGKETDAISVFEYLIKKVGYTNSYSPEILKSLAISYMRLGERQNCVLNHSSESCIMPIQNLGIHQKQAGSRKAIEIYQQLLTTNPKDYESMWLLNIAYMTLGEYPSKVPHQWLIPNLDKDNSNFSIKPFVDVAPKLKLNNRNMAGGVIVDDFNNDNYLDIVTSDWGLKGAMHYYKNNKKGGFIDCSAKSDLGRFTGGLNMIQADYDNDGDVDIFVLRGAWMGRYGKQANSLLRNNGDDTFTDVTIKSGLLSEFPTQAGVWRDFNNDGWLDLYIGNENNSDTDETYPSELYISKRDGTFKEVALATNCQIKDYVKGVTASDYDNDGLVDLYLSGVRGKRTLLRNTGIKNGFPQFEDVTHKAGLDDVKLNTFPTWFWDYDNDGWLDIFVCGYQFDQSIAYTVATESFKIPNNGSTMYLYHNNHDGTFTNVTKKSGLDKAVFGMGSNFGDIDNDGNLDMYIGTGNPDYKSLIPNRLFRNMGDGKFADVTISGRVGNIQKGHGVAINDLDNDGDSDIFIEMGGAYIGDSYNNSLYLNPGQNTNNWLSLQLEGTTINRSAIGTRLKISFRENGIKRNIYREVNSGGSFGSSALKREIGIGQATLIDEIEITWSKTQKKQVFKNIKPNQFIKIKEGSNGVTRIKLNKINFPTDTPKSSICKT